MHSRLLYLLTNFHFQLNWSCFIKWPSYWRVRDCLGLCSSLLFFYYFWKLDVQTNRVSSVSPAFHVSDRLDQSSYHLLIPTPICWHSRSRQTFHHGLQLKQPFTFQTYRTFTFSQPKHGIEACRMTAFKPNACPQELTAAAVFTIKQLKWVIAECDCTSYVSWELKSMLNVFYYYVFFNSFLVFAFCFFWTPDVKWIKLKRMIIQPKTYTYIKKKEKKKKLLRAHFENYAPSFPYVFCKNKIWSQRQISSPVVFRFWNHNGGAGRGCS